MLCRQPELFQGVTLDEYTALQASGEIDAYGFSTKDTALRGSEAADSDNLAASDEPAAVTDQPSKIEAPEEAASLTANLAAESVDTGLAG